MIQGKFQSSPDLERIFMPNARAGRDKFYGEKDRARFAHYTSSEAALSIIKTKRMWMRNTTCMSDYREVNHGFELLNTFFRDEDNKGRFIKALNSCSPKIAEDALDLFRECWTDIQFNTYIASFSEHDDDEDMHGRLSMWRAFGGNSARVGRWCTSGLRSGGTGTMRLRFY